MIRRRALEEAMAQAMRLAATRLPPDVEAALLRAETEEKGSLARAHLSASLEAARAAREGDGLLCGDTGYPLFFVTCGTGVRIEGGPEAIWEAARSATRRVTGESFLRPTMVDPLTRANPGDNVGAGMPRVELEWGGPAGLLQIVAAPKGGGSEIFGTWYRMLYPADGLPGVLRFVIDSIREGCYAGKICPPAIVGVGIGGTADLCMAMAKKAAVLRAVGSRHPEPEVRGLEERLLEASRSLGTGPMGARGVNAVMAVHVATAATHTAGLPVAVNAQCLVGRRWRALLRDDGRRGRQQTRYTGALDE